jgi:hypothetical protein
MKEVTARAATGIADHARHSGVGQISGTLHSIPR